MKLEKIVLVVAFLAMLAPGNTLAQDASASGNASVTEAEPQAPGGGEGSYQIQLRQLVDGPSRNAIQARIFGPPK